MTKPIIIVQGGQYGSEAKGAIAAHLCTKHRVKYAVRTGATNAGHTVYHNGVAYKMQQLPVGWINPGTDLVIGAGALVDPEILIRETLMIRAAGYRGRVFLDPRAGMHLPAHHDRSSASGRHHSIGATGKGCSEALVDRIMGRGRGYQPLGAWLSSHTVEDLGEVVDTESLLNRAYDQGEQILLEGTQGQGLDLYLGPYPYTTHKQTGPAQWMLEAGLSPALAVDIVMVARTFPIRVAGNSGPLPGETSWPALAFEINHRLISQSLPPLVSWDALSTFMSALEVASEQPGTDGGMRFDIPVGYGVRDQHEWPDRARYASTLSELNAAAWRILEPATRDELSKLFELTTVTKKLRRVAKLDLGDLARYCRQIRPHRIALTFLNYVFPERWGGREVGGEPLTEEMLDYVDRVSLACRAPVEMVSWGPEDHHIQTLVP